MRAGRRKRTCHLVSVSSRAHDAPARSAGDIGDCRHSSASDVGTSDVNRKPKFWLSDKKPKPIWFLVFQLKFYWYFVGFKILTNFRCRDNSS